MKKFRILLVLCLAAVVSTALAGCREKKDEPPKPDEAAQGAPNKPKDHPAH